MTVRSVHYFEDVIQHTRRGDCWVTVHGKVYDVTTFLEDHPGGDEVLLAASGKDATIDFEAVGHSDDALDLMKKYCIGEVERSTLPIKQRAGPKAKPASGGNHSYGGFVKILQLLVPLLILGFALALRHYKN